MKAASTPDLETYQERGLEPYPALRMYYMAFWTPSEGFTAAEPGINEDILLIKLLKRRALAG